jgi:hypothetical protein
VQIPLSFRSASVQQNWPLLGLPFLTVAFVLFTLCRKLANRKVRLAITAVIPIEIEFEDADPAEFSGLDKEQLARLTEQMEKLVLLVFATTLRKYLATRLRVALRGYWCIARSIASRKSWRPRRPW